MIDHLGSCLNAVIPKNTDIPFEIAVEGNKIVQADVDDNGIADEVVFVIAEGFCLHVHVVQGNGKLASDGIGRFLPAAGLLVQVEAPLAKEFVVVFNEDTGTHAQRTVQIPVTATLDSTGDLARADLQTGVQAAIGSDGFGIRET